MYGLVAKFVCRSEQDFKNDIMQLVEDLIERLMAEELELFLMQCWIIWNQRNSVMRGGVIRDLNQLHR